ncbi:MAG: DUF3592 domain-containing protein [Candidatus Hodarchaeales archaeon]|jgi:uncharacterized membrane protein
MNKVVEEIQINVPKERIWSIITNYHNKTDWMSTHRDPSVSDSNISIGTKSTFIVYKIANFQGGTHYVSPERRTYEIIGLERYKRLSEKLTDGLSVLKAYQTHLVLKSDGNSTLVSMTAEYKVKLGLFGFMLNKLGISKQIRSELRETIVNLKKFAESGEKSEFKKVTELRQPLHYVGKNKDISKPVRDDQHPQLPPPSLDRQPEFAWKDMRPQKPVKKAKPWQTALFLMGAIVITILFGAFFMTDLGRYIIIMALFLLIGSFLLLTSINNIKLGRASKTWPAVKGTILHSRVARQEGGSYAAIVQYMYAVNGKEYKSEAINAAPGWWAWGLQRAAKKKVAQYAPDKIVDVNYNPQSPEKAILEPGIHLSGPFSMLLGVILLIVFLVVFSVGGFIP